MEIPDVADLVWLFEDEPEPQHEDLHWPIGLHSFRLTRGATAVLFSIDPLSGEAYISLYVDEDEIVFLRRLQPLGRLSVEKVQPHYEGLKLWFRDEAKEPIMLQTKPAIRLSWDAKGLGEW